MQCEMLFDVEVVLFVDDYEVELCEFDCVLDDCVCIDYELCGVECGCFDCCVFFFCFQVVCELCDCDVEWFELCVQFVCVLFCEDFGGCYQCSLVVGVDCLCGGQCCDDCFVVVDVVLQQLLYWVCECEVVCDFVDDVCLCVCQCEWQCCVKVCGQCVGIVCGVVWYCGCGVCVVFFVCMFE